MSDLLDALHEGLRAAREHGASDAEVSAESRTLGTTRFANSYVTQAAVIVEQRARVRVALGRRLGSATTSGLDRDALADAALRATQAARVSPEQEGFGGFARPAPLPSVPAAWSEATAAYGAADRTAVLAPMLARAARDGLTCAGGFVTGPRRRAVVTAGGVAHEHALTEAALSLIAVGEGTSGYAVFAGHDLAGLDGAALAEEACGKAVAGRDPVEIEAAPYDVVLSPSAVSELLEWMAMASFSARAVLDEASLLCGRAGEQVCDPRITLVDDVGYAHPGAVPWPFDTEGTPRQRVPILDAGRARGPVSDLTTAARLGVASTGHAAPFGLELSDEPVAANLVLHPGEDRVEDLIGRVERGLYITRFHYVNGLLDTRKATMTGMTRDGTFLIEGGRLGRAVRNLRFTESILEAFGRIGGVGRELAAVPQHWIQAGTYLAPALLLRAFRFTGRSR